MSENPRILELRRRVQADPASIIFAQLAEECRRTGANDEAVAICRAGLAHHSDCLSARVTLGRALIELGRLDEAQTELLLVLNRAPAHLPANRAIAEMYQTRDRMPEALAHYQRALELARHDPGLEQQVEQIENVVSPPHPPAPGGETTRTAIEELFDFDRLLEQLVGSKAPKPKSTLPTTAPSAIPVTMAPSALESVELQEDDGDPFAVLERQLRKSDEQRAHEEMAAPPDEVESVQRQLADLEGWLSAIVIDRDHRPRA